ncbi:MAG: FecR family protein [Ignavibacteriae bacterium]|nr:FecR family protein [Ignavibacteriota bacterium]
MKRKTILLAIVVLSALIVSPAWRQQQEPKDIAAWLIKVKKDVTKKTPSSGWTEALAPDKLASGHLVRTEESSFALIRFADQTKLVVRENTEVEIKGQVQGRQILDRNVHTTRGKITFDVKKQEKEAFRFSSPISVASIRGTTGSYRRDDENNVDNLGIGTGLATFTNLLSNLSLDVSNNQTGTADGDGGLTVRESTPEELLLNTEDDNMFDETNETGGKTRELRLGAEDKQGNKKTIIIQWEEKEDQ